VELAQVVDAQRRLKTHRQRRYIAISNISLRLQLESKGKVDLYSALLQSHL